MCLPEIPSCCLLRSPGQKYSRAVIFLSGSTRWTIPAIPIVVPNTSRHSKAWQTSPPKPRIEGAKIHIHAPLMHMSKAQIIKQGASLGLDYSLTVSCYQADEAGRACGVCDSCRIRRTGFQSAQVPDPTHYQTRVPIVPQLGGRSKIKRLSISRCIDDSLAGS